MNERILLKDLPREFQLGDKIRYRDGLVTVEWFVAGVDYNYAEADRLWLTHETGDRFCSFWIDRRKVKEWLTQPGVSVLLTYGEN